MARATIVLDDLDKPGQIGITLTYHPEPAAGDTLTKAQSIAYQFLNAMSRGIDVDEVITKDL